MRPSAQIAAACVLVCIWLASLARACPLVTPVDCATNGAGVLPLSVSDMLDACASVPACASSVWGAGALTPDLGYAMLAQNLALLDGTAALTLLCSTSANVTCLSREAVLNVQALALAYEIRAGQLCSAGLLARYDAATATYECYCPPNHVCTPVLPSSIAFEVCWSVLALFALVATGVLVRRTESPAASATDPATASKTS